MREPTEVCEPEGRRLGAQGKSGRGGQGKVSPLSSVLPTVSLAP